MQTFFRFLAFVGFLVLFYWFIIIIIIIIKNEKIRVTLCENAAGALYIVNKMCVDGLRNVQCARVKQVNDDVRSN